MKATFHTHPKTFNELRQSLAVALVHGRFSLAERTAYNLADTSNEGSSAGTDSAWSLWREIESLTPREKETLAKEGFWESLSAYVHDWFIDADLGDSVAARRFANFCAEHLEGSSHHF